MELNKSDLTLLRKCVKASLSFRTHFVTTFKPGMESGIPTAVEPKSRRTYMRFVAVEIPQLTALLQKLKGK